MSSHRTAAEQQFYRSCAELLGVEGGYRPRRFAQANRWNNRAPGNGRFPGFGLIRMFGPRHIQLSLRRPRKINATCSSAEEALSLLQGALGTTERPL